MRIKFKAVLFVLTLVFVAACGGDSAGGDGGDGSGEGNGSDSDPSHSGENTDDDNAPTGGTAGDGVCEAGENAHNTPEDCPAVAGDGFCTLPENAATTPQDCPSVLGDGLCTAGETFLNAEVDCPPPDLTVSTTMTIDQVLAISPNLHFGTLDVQATIYLAKASDVTFHAKAFSLSGSLNTQDVGQCDQRAAPNVTIIADTVNISGSIVIDGASGQESFPSAPQCSCYGGDGGDLTITTNNLTFTGSVYADGGLGSRIIYSDTYASIEKVGCNGGQGGYVRFDSLASSTSNGRVNVNGGIGGTSFYAAQGTYAPITRVLDIASGGFDSLQAVVLAAQDPHVSIQEAQVISGNSIVTGTVKDGVQTSAGYLTFLATRNAKTARDFQLSTPYQDKIEQLYRLRNSGTTTRKYNVALAATGSVSADIDLEVFNAATMTKLFEGFTNQPSEAGSFTLLAGEEALLGVSSYANSKTVAYRLAVTPGF